ncbi:ATP-binding sensor histidine kinase [Oscillatoria sp. FACHB-1406]|uniref:trifunctional serine/threonine-protein kinase/ATP-binding protein/sensor histidine kinase n=1 Tax=Oscillatoria sp. FACHB-1406 TaxID=2692846 RepID=UPI0016883E86|nr:ATP-binding sensor histidine kinase [Oscillatoria sp. FACHB-1406]MBD2578043.1 AAA family ATPase [Oscillatoria sp. FACHB-1406]
MSNRELSPISANGNPVIELPGYRFRGTLYKTQSIVVCRGLRLSDNQPVTIKVPQQDYPTFNELLQFRNQYAIARNLDIPGIVRPYSLEPYRNSYALVMEDFGGVSLRDYAKQHPLLVACVLEIAVQVADILHTLHANFVIHKDIKPANILIHPQTQQVKLIDFSIASLLPKETQEIKNPKGLEGTLAYIAPEQTGRMNRAIDYRSDFYSLGVTLFELLAGELPFQSNDLMELVHCHIAQKAPSLVQFGVPEVVASIVAKLMAKNAEDRYQSALGLKYDLERCLAQLQETGRLEPFEIGKRDLCDRFIIPEKLYGREAEVLQLLEAFERVSTGSTEMMLVAGFSGIGKTAVINEVHKPIVRQHGYFIKGKFDQFNRNIPFSAFVQAFRDLMQQLMSESDRELQAWKTQILEAVGDNGQLLIEVIPELERLIGVQPPVAELSGTAAQNRFNFLFQKFIAVFTTVEHPLVLFLDDLQWTDSASLGLMKLLMEDKGHLLLLGAYRDNEVSPVHPFILTVDELVKTGATVTTMTLPPLHLHHINRAIADTLGCQPEAAQPLSKFVYQKTRGNPFFTVHFLKGLHQDDCITFDYQTGIWQCDLAQVRSLSLTDDVVEFMAAQLQKLPAETQTVLKFASCIGAQFDLSALAIVSEQFQTETSVALWKALQEGLILPISQTYKFFQSRDVEIKEQEISVPYKFLHDRVQQAAYSLILESQKKATHHKIGQRLLNGTSTSDREERIFEIVNQLNIAIELIEEPREREELSKLNWLAGCKAKNSTAYSAAVKYFAVGRDLLARDCWQSQYDLTLALHIEAVEAAHLNSDLDEMECLVKVVLQQAKTALDTVKVYAVRIAAYTSQGQLLKAIHTGLTILKQFEIDLPESPDLEDVARVGQKNQALLGSKKPMDLLALPEMKNPQALAAMQILNEISVPAYLTKPNLNSLIVMIQINLSMMYGNAPISALGYSSYGLFLCAVADDIEQGHEFGKLALKLLSKFKEKKLEAKVLFVTAAFIIHWKAHVRKVVNILKTAYSTGWENGSLTDAGYAAYGYGFHCYLMGYELSKLEQEMTAYSKVLAQTSQQTQLNYNEIYRQTVLNLLGQTVSPFLLLGAADRENKLLAKYQKANDKTGLWHFFFTKLMLCYLFQEFEQALKYIEQAEHNIGGGKGMFSIPAFYFYASLTRLAVLPKSAKSIQENFLQQVANALEKLKKWGENAPMNYLHKFHLVEAERYRVSDEKIIAIDLYDRAISGAKENGYIQEEALANELAAKFYLDWGKEKVASGYMQEAYYCYAKWGAKAKTDDLEKCYPQLLQPILQQRRINLNSTETIATITQTLDSTSAFISRIPDALDFASVLKAARAISSSIELDELMASLTRILLENSGAKKSALVLLEDGIMQVRAITHINDRTEIETILVSQPLERFPDLPKPIINYVKNTQKSIIIDDLKTDISGLIGTYMLAHQPQSVCCTPVLNQGHLVGVMYLENQLARGVFTSARLQAIDLLCSQSAIALENAQLYRNLQSSKARFLRLAENAPGMIYQFQLSPDGIPKFNYVSAGCYEIYEVLPEEVEANADRLLSLTHPEDEPYFQESVALSAQTLESWQYEGRVITPSGQLKWVQASSNPIKEADGTIIWDGLLLETTERKQAEMAVKQKSQELEAALQNLQQAQLTIVQSEKMSALGNLVAGVAHEINNPLGFISGNITESLASVQDLTEVLQLYQEKFPNPGNEIEEKVEEIDLEYVLEDFPKMLAAMQAGCDRIEKISTSLRIFSRADRDEKVSFNLHEGIDSTLLILKHRLKANGNRPEIQVITNYDLLPAIQCFPGQLNQVFMNILTNAIEAIEEAIAGRSAAEISAKPSRITIRTRAENEEVKIAIADNGVGIPEELQAKIFDHLFTTKAVGKGTGLGLAIARQIVVEKHGGKLEVNSKIGQGTEFLISLPLN